ncbi:hypothetical protein NGTWS0302_29400 [Mycolicibacterium cyprinidarum]|uniref:PASTA domain-containing protein n=1 Tax=Mycolicibacterium cyprinidarum TaxID=2860311 RepID=A0ABQ4V3F4_9MYCO|nr:hypothetical protein NGTWS1702_31670 [Mycolicibacterium sp. NGTWSNA01]GJF11697.1 hypothetical protein NGTWS0302_29400 [Mycolicibacterium sp. NGTWS0302]
MKHFITAVATTCAVFAGAICAAGPAVATKDGKIRSPGSDDMTWVMPDMKGMVLKHAIIAVLHVTEPVNLNIRTVARGHQPVINQEGWVVCGQFPKKGVKISQKTKKVTFAVQRPHDQSCA